LRFAGNDPLGLRKWMVGSYLVITVGCWLGSWAPNIVIFMVGIGAIRPCGEATAFVLSGSILQLEVLGPVRGRVFAVESGIKTLLECFGSLGAGFLYDNLQLNAHTIAYVYSAMSSVIGVFWGVYYFYWKAHHYSEDNKYHKLPVL